MCQGRDERGNPIVVDRSGSCAIVVLIVEDVCYTANVGDSRAILSMNSGHTVKALSRDHKPSDVHEYNRIIQNGGQVYQTTTAQTIEDDPKIQGKQLPSSKKDLQAKNEPEYIVGPIRVLPGRLSVSRTFGDPEAKLAYRGGNVNVVKAEPEVHEFQISKVHDFIVMASDGVYDKMSNDDIVKCVWESCDRNKWQQNQNQKASQSVHQQCGLAVESVLKNALYRQSLDNVTVVMIGFQNFKRKVFGKSKNSEREEQEQSAQVTSSQTEMKTQKSSFHKESTYTRPGTGHHMDSRTSSHQLASSISPLPPQSQKAPSGQTQVVNSLPKTHGISRLSSHQSIPSNPNPMPGIMHANRSSSNSGRIGSAGFGGRGLQNPQSHFSGPHQQRPNSLLNNFVSSTDLPKEKPQFHSGVRQPSQPQRQPIASKYAIQPKPQSGSTSGAARREKEPSPGRMQLYEPNSLL